MNILPVLLKFPIKDWLIAISLFILLLCILEIRKLKKTIAKDAQKRLIPQLILEFNSDTRYKEAGFHLKNESFFLAKDINIENLRLTLKDFGFEKDIILKFAGLDFIRPQEKIQLKFDVLDLNEKSMPEITEKIIPHLISPPFKIKISYSNLENLKFHIVFSKTKNKFHTESLEFDK